jgi:hypothetical protein
MFSLAFRFFAFDVPQSVPQKERKLAVDASGALRSFLSSTPLPRGRVRRASISSVTRRTPSRARSRRTRGGQFPNERSGSARPHFGDSDPSVEPSECIAEVVAIGDVRRPRHDHDHAAADGDGERRSPGHDGQGDRDDVDELEVGGDRAELRSAPQSGDSPRRTRMLQWH